MGELPASLPQTFVVAASELGMCGASWLFARRAHAVGGDAMVGQLGEELGAHYPVLRAVTREWLDGHRAPPLALDSVLGALRDMQRVLVVGLEAPYLDALIPALAGTEAALVDYSILEMDTQRVVSNYGGRLKVTSLAAFQSWAGARSALLTFAYGHDGHDTRVRPAWLRIVGPDVRVQFRKLIGWNVLRDAMQVYPRWLVETPLGAFSDVV